MRQPKPPHQKRKLRFVAQQTLRKWYFLSHTHPDGICILSNSLDKCISKRGYKYPSRINKPICAFIQFVEQQYYSRNKRFCQEKAFVLFRLLLYSLNNPYDSGKLPPVLIWAALVRSKVGNLHQGFFFLLITFLFSIKKSRKVMKKLKPEIEAYEKPPRALGTRGGKEF